MGKKRAGVRNGSPTQLTVAEEAPRETGSEAAKLKDEGNKLFGRKEYQKALDAYERALKAAGPDTPNEAALLHSNKAACYMMIQRFKEAVNECTNALEVDPVYAKALIRRAKAYEAMGHYKQALHDIQKANKADSANPDTQEAEKRLKDLVSGKSRVNGMVTGNGTAKKGPAKNSKQPMLVFPVKCDLKGEVRGMHILGHTSYAELLEQVSLKFPAAGPFIIKYLDKEGDLVTITERADLNRALEECVTHADKLSSSSQHGSRCSLQSLLPPLRLSLVPVESQDEVPSPPTEELLQLEQVQQARRVLQAQAMGQAQKKAAEPEQQQEVYEIEQWLVDFANLFRDALGVEPDRHIDLTNFGWEKLQAALDTAVISDKAPALFDQAAERFQEVTAHGMLQWGNVHMCKAKRLIDKAAAEGEPLDSVRADAEALFDQAEAKYREALATKPDFYDGAASIGNLFFERGKLAAGFVVIPPKPDEPADKSSEVAKPAAAKPEDKAGKTDKETQEATQAANQAAQQKALQEALEKLTPEGLAKGEELFEKAWEQFAAAIEMLPESERNKPLKPVQAGQEASPEEDPNVWAHCQVMWGNLLYELSQMRAAVGQPWRPPLDEAVGKFRASGCPEADIRTALKSHTQKEHIDLGPEPEPEKKPEEVTEKPVTKPESLTKPESASKPKEDDKEVKGLPGLGPKPKKKPATVTEE